MDPKFIRNFSIVAHIDHGKSTLADGLLQYTGALQDRELKQQYLDSMDIERERGITIKAQTVRLMYTADDGETYQLNLIDTPGHVDFAYEVSRSLEACEGALLVVDAAQGVEAQTLANVYLAMDADLEIIPVLNKIDLPAADVESVRQQIEEVIGIDASDAIEASAKNKIGIKDILERVIRDVPPPKDNTDKPLRALVFDAWFDAYQGVIVLVRLVDGSIKKGTRIKFMQTNADYEVLRLGTFNPKPTDTKELSSGEVGYIICGLKDLKEVQVGDTVTTNKQGASEALEGFKEVKPMVFSGIFPVESPDYKDLQEALEKLCLNDSSLSFEVESSAALGFGFRCGFLGLLHMEIVQERLEREFNLDLITTAPTVVHHVYKTNGEMAVIENPSQLEIDSQVERIEEPYVRLALHTPSDSVGALLKLCEERRGVQEKMEYIAAEKVVITYRLPLSEMVFDFYDKLKSVSKGYASMEYELIEYAPADLVKIDVMINGDSIDALAIIVHRDKAQSRGRILTKKLKEIIPRQQYQVAIQAAIGANIIARETLGALRKDVTAKCYGGDISRKRKLLEKQKAGKKRMKQIGQIEIPQKAFLAVLKTD